MRLTDSQMFSNEQCFLSPINDYSIGVVVRTISETNVVEINPRINRKTIHALHTMNGSSGGRVKALSNKRFILS